MIELQSVLERPLAAATDELRNGSRPADTNALPAFPGTVFGEAELKAMRAALDELSARFGIAPDSVDYQAAAVAIVRIAGTGHIDATQVAALAAIELGLNRPHEP